MPCTQPNKLLQSFTSELQKNGGPVFLQIRQVTEPFSALPPENDDTDGVEKKCVS